MRPFDALRCARWRAWPLGLMLGAPIALFAGLAFSLVMFIKPPVREPDLEAAAPPRAVDGDDDGDDH